MEFKIHCSILPPASHFFLQINISFVLHLLFAFHVFLSSSLLLLIFLFGICRFWFFLYFNITHFNTSYMYLWRSLRQIQMKKEKTDKKLFLVSFFCFFLLNFIIFLHLHKFFVVVVFLYLFLIWISLCIFFFIISYRLSYLWIF